MFFKKHHRVIFAIIGALLLLGLARYASIVYSLEDLVEAELGELDLSEHRDGYYKGVYRDGRWSSIVEVSVEDGRISEVYFTDKVKDKDVIADIIARRVIESQSLDVEVVSGATASSNVYLKAIEEAFDYEERESQK